MESQQDEAVGAGPIVKGSASNPGTELESQRTRGSPTAVTLSRTCETNSSDHGVEDASAATSSQTADLDAPGLNKASGEDASHDPGQSGVAQTAADERSSGFRYGKKKNKGKRTEIKQDSSTVKVGTPYYYYPWQSRAYWIPPRTNSWNSRRFNNRRRTHSESVPSQETRCLLEFNERKRVIYIKGNNTRSLNIAIKADPIFNKNICLRTDVVEVYDEMFCDYVECDQRTLLQQGAKLRVRKGILDLQSLEENLPCAFENVSENAPAENVEAQTTAVKNEVLTPLSGEPVA